MFIRSSNASENPVHASCVALVCTMLPSTINGLSQSHPLLATTRTSWSSLPGLQRYFSGKPPLPVHACIRWCLTMCRHMCAKPKTHTATRGVFLQRTSRRLRAKTNRHVNVLIEFLILSKGVRQVTKNAQVVCVHPKPKILHRIWALLKAYWG